MDTRPHWLKETCLLEFTLLNLESRFYSHPCKTLHYLAAIHDANSKHCNALWGVDSRCKRCSSALIGQYKLRRSPVSPRQSAPLSGSNAIKSNAMQCNTSGSNAIKRGNCGVTDRPLSYQSHHATFTNVSTNHEYKHICNYKYKYSCKYKYK